MIGLTFDAERHAYELDGRAVPSITHVLAPLIDFSYLPAYVRDDVLLRGRLVHDAIAADIVHDLDDVQFARECPRLMAYVDAWRAFKDARAFAPLLSEYRVASPRHQVAGTIDTLGVLDGHAALIDFKTGRPADVVADLQTAAYLGLALEWSAYDAVLRDFLKRYPVIRRYAVQLRPDGSFKVEAYTDPKDFRDFLALLTAYHVTNARRRRAHTAIEAA